MKRRSGPTQSTEARRAAGRVRWELWIDAGLAARVDGLRGETTRRKAVEAALMILVLADASRQTWQRFFGATECLELAKVLPLMSKTQLRKLCSGRT